MRRLGVLLVALSLSARAGAEEPGAADDPGVPPPGAKDGPAAGPAAEKEAPPATVGTRAKTPPDERVSLRRAYGRLRPTMLISRQYHPPVGGGMGVDAGIEYNGRPGFRVGLDLNAMLGNHLLAFKLRVDLGFSLRRFGASIALATGYADAGDRDDRLYHVLPEIGPIIRIGRFEGTHAVFRLMWMVASPVPNSGDLQVNIFLRERLRLNLHLAGGAFSPLQGVGATVGVQYLLRGTGGRGTTLITAGAGVHSWFVASGRPTGPLLSIAVEQRW